MSRTSAFVIATTLLSVVGLACSAEKVGSPECTSSSDCTGGRSCIDGRCEAPMDGGHVDGGTDAGFDSGLTDCDGTAVDTETDAANCGGCGLVCPSGFSCVTGSCTDDPSLSIGGFTSGSPDGATVAGQVWVVLDVAGLTGAAPGEANAPRVTFGDDGSGGAMVAPAALGDYHAGAGAMYGQGPSPDLAHLTAIAPPHVEGTVPIVVEQGGRTAMLLDAFHYETITLPAEWTTRGRTMPGGTEFEPGFLVGRADRPGMAPLPDGSLAVGGGNCAANSWCSMWPMVEVYSPPSGTARVAGGALHVARAWIESVALVDGRVLFTGGVRSDTACGEVPSYDVDTMTETCPYDGNVNAAGVAPVASAAADVYDPSTDEVTAVGDMSAPRSGHTVTLLADGRVLVVGGSSSTHWSTPPAGAAAEIFDPVAGTFTPVDPGIAAVVDHSAGRMPDGDVLVAGGRTAASHPNAVAGAHTLHVGAGGAVTATPVADLPNIMMNGDPANRIVMVPDGRMFVVPGLANDGTGAMYVWDPAASSWSTLSSSPPPANWPGAALGGDGTILVCGGSDSTCGGHTTCSQVDPAAGTTTPFMDLATLVRESPMAGLPSGGLVMTGGTSGETPTDCGGDAANNTISLLLPE